MSKQNKPSKEATFEAGESWAVEAAARGRRSERIAWWIAACAAVIALLEAVALAGLLPLKTIVPYTVLVDRQTGYTVLVDPAQAKKIDPASALNQSFLSRYVRARQGYDFDLAPEDYQLVMSWSASPIRNDYARSMRADNPDSPVAKYGRGQRIDTRILSVTPLDNDSAIVRFETTLEGSVGPASANQWVAMIDYHYVPRPMSWEESLINPLGFEVTSYRVSPEAAPSSTAVEGAEL